MRCIIIEDLREKKVILSKMEMSTVVDIRLFLCQQLLPPRPVPKAQRLLACPESGNLGIWKSFGLSRIWNLESGSILAVFWPLIFPCYYVTRLLGGLNYEFF